MMQALGNREAVETRHRRRLPRVVVQAGKAPVVDGEPERRMRVGCGSATIGIFASSGKGHADEVVVVDDHITGVLTEHQAGRFLDMRPRASRCAAASPRPGRYFQVAEPGHRLGRHEHHRSAGDHRAHRPGVWPGRACGC
jgi:hypothetical protein